MAEATRYRAVARIPGNRARTAVLDALAVAAGASCIVLAIAAGHSAAYFRSAPIYGLAPDVVAVSGTAQGVFGVEQGLQTSSLTADDVTTLGSRSSVPDAEIDAPTVGLRTSVASVGRSQTTDVIGSTGALDPVLGYSIAHGRALTPLDVSAAAPVALLGQTVVSDLFATDNPVGQYVTIGTHAFQVVGTLQPLGFSGSFDRDDVVEIPITAAQTVLLPNQLQRIDQVLLRAPDPVAARAVQREATAALLKQHVILNPALADFTVQGQAQLAAPRTRDALAVRRVLEIAGVLLLVAGGLHLTTVFRRRFGVRRSYRRDQVPLSDLTRALSLGILAGGVGAVAAVAVGPLLRRLGPGLQFERVTVYGLVIGAASAVLTSALAYVPSAMRRQRVPRRPPGVSAELGSGTAGAAVERRPVGAG